MLDGVEQIQPQDSIDAVDKISAIGVRVKPRQPQFSDLKGGSVKAKGLGNGLSASSTSHSLLDGKSIVVRLVYA